MNYYETADGATITAEEFMRAAKEFVKISDSIWDGWRIFENGNDIYKSFIKKNTYLEQDEHSQSMLKAEYVIYYNPSYGVPSFSFNIWNSSGVLLTLEDIRNLSFIKLNRDEFFTVITQQEHPVFSRPYFIMHPCHTSTLLATFKTTSKNIIITFLSLIAPLIRLKLPLQYGL